MKMHILACTDHRFVIPTGVMIRSVCVNNKNIDIVFHVIVDDSVSYKDKSKISKVLGFNHKIHYYNVNVSSLNIKLPVVAERFPVSIYYRLLMTRFLPQSIDKILYMDADIIVRGRLDDLWKINLNGKAFGAVLNQSNANNYWERLNYDKNLGYINSGVLLVNLKYWREAHVTERFLKYIKDNSNVLIYPDQDVLNSVLKGERILLHERYNLQEAFLKKKWNDMAVKNSKQMEEAIDNPCVVHYTGIKPWQLGCNHPLKKLYYFYKEQTSWKYNLSMEIRIFLNIKKFINHIRFIIDLRKDENNQYRNVNLKYGIH